MKKLMSILLVLIMSMGIIGCGTDKSEELGTSTETANESEATQEVEGNEKLPAEKMKIGVSLPSPANQWVGALIESAEAEAQKDTDKFDIKVVVSDTPSEQVGAIEDLMQEELDVLVVLPLESAPLTPICDELYAQGTEILVLDRGIYSESYTSFIAGDNYGIGVSAANYIGERLGGKGDVVEILGVPSEIVTQRSMGFKETLEEKYPDINIVAQATGNFSRERSLSAMEDILQSQDSIDAVYSHDDEQSLGIEIAVRSAERGDEMFLTGAGGNKSVFEGMMSGDSLIEATFIYSPFMGGTAVRIAKAMAENKSLEDAAEEDVWLRMSLEDEYGEDYMAEIGEEIPRVITLSAATVTEENVDDFYNPDSSY